jgi:hypothetical protein
VGQQTARTDRGDLKLGEAPAFRTAGFHTTTRFDPGLSSERLRLGVVHPSKANTRVINLLHAKPIGACRVTKITADETHTCHKDRGLFAVAPYF